MNTLYSQFLVEISSINCVYGETPKQDKDDVILTAKNCTTIAVEFALGFNEWMDTSDEAIQYFRSHRVQLEPKMDGSHNDKIKAARKELLEKYISTLK